MGKAQRQVFTLLPCEVSDEILVLRYDEHIDLQTFHPPVICTILAGVLAKQLLVPNIPPQAQHLKAQGRSNPVDDTLLAGLPQYALLAEKLPTAHGLGGALVQRRNLPIDTANDASSASTVNTQG